MTHIKDYFQRNWINYLLFFLLAAGSLYLKRIPEDAVLLVAVLPYILLAVNLLLAVLFNKSKLFFTLLVTGFALLVTEAWQPESRYFDLLFFCAGLLVPLNALLFANTRERGIFSPAGRAKLLLLAGEALLVFYCLIFQETGLTALRETALLPASLQRSLVPDDLVLLLFLFTLLIFILRDFFKRDSNQSVQFFSLAMVFLAMLRPGDDLWHSLFFTGGGLYHLMTLVQKSYTMAYLDDLTGVPGRRALNEDLHKLSGLFSLAMIDIDHFKQFNDKNGHDVGDEALRHVARTMKRALRGGRLYRFGGEEFAVIYPGRDTAHAQINLEEIRRKVETEPLVIRTGRSGSKKLMLTVSLGFAESADDTRAQAVLKLADQALYRAKEKGRNQVSR